AVREEQRDGAALEERLGAALEDPEVDEPLSDYQRGSPMHLAPFDPWSARLDRRAQGPPDDAVEVLLLRTEGSRGGIGAGHIAGVTAVLASRVDQHQFATAERACGRREMKDRRVRPAGDNRLVGERVRAAAEELRLQLDLQLPFGSSLADQLVEREEPRTRRALGRA